MLKGKKLGEAIAKAIDIKKESGSISTLKEVADHFGIQPPSIHDWINRGTISKDKLPELFSHYFQELIH